MPKGQYDRTRPRAPDGEVMEAEPPVKTLPDGCKPIDTAPMNGMQVLLYNMDITHGVHGFWRRSRHCIGSRWRTNDCWADPLTLKPLGAVWTHWRPIG